MKKKAFFVTSGGWEAIHKAYDEACLATLRQTLEFLPLVESMEALEANRALYAEAAFVFSTWGMLPLSETEIAAYLPNLRAVFYAAGSVQRFARPFLRQSITVCSAWAANAVPVAETAFSEILLANKGFFQASRLYKQGDTAGARALTACMPGNYGTRVGLLGVGMIGKMVARRLQTVELEVWAYDPFLPKEKAEELGLHMVGLEELFAHCQVVSNHLADNEQTRGMLCYAHFALLPPNGCFLNTGRHRQIVEDDLLRALRERSDLTAVLDVTDPNEPLPAGHPFYDLPNVVLTPHLAGSLGLEVRRMGRTMAEEYALLVGGREPRYAVTERMLETMA